MVCGYVCMSVFTCGSMDGVWVCMYVCVYMWEYGWCVEVRVHGVEHVSVNGDTRWYIYTYTYCIYRACV